MNVAVGPIVGLQLQSRPQSLTIVRGMLSGVAELLEMDPELLDDLKTAVSEACNNVVLHAYPEAPGPMTIRLYADDEALTVRVADEGSGVESVSAGADAAEGIGVSVIRALAADTEFASREGGGTEVTMRFTGRRDGHALFAAPSAAGGDLTLAPPARDSEVALTLSPVSLLTGVLGRLARTLAATAHFSLDRFSDVYLITDTLAAHASRAATGERIGARLDAGERRLELVVGPFRRGSGELLTADGADPVGSPLAMLADELAIAEWGEDEAVDVVVVDHRR